MQEIIIAVSGGPDSMALLDMSYKLGHDIIVAHVNYQVRDTANRDQEIIEEYCFKHDLMLEVYYPELEEGNFQANARKQRYDFMEALAKMYNIADVYVAHHQDDVLETYIMQKNRGSIPEYYGIKEKSRYGSINIVRPLLKYSKQALINYCDLYEVAYGIDESNLESNYTRNYIRNNELANLSEADKESLLEEINQRNQNLSLKRATHRKDLLKFKETYLINVLLELSDPISILRLLFSEYGIYNISLTEFENIIKFLKSGGNGVYEINQEYLIDKSYGCLTIVENKPVQYCYTFESVIDFSCDYFDIKSNGKSTEAVTLCKEDFPITIRNYEEGDYIQMRFGRKMVNRFFIDRKIPQFERVKWPIVLNAANEVILVPGLGCNLAHYSNIPSMFVVK